MKLTRILPALLALAAPLLAQQSAAPAAAPAPTPAPTAPRTSPELSPEQKELLKEVKALAPGDRWGANAVAGGAAAASGGDGWLLGEERGPDLCWRCSIAADVDGTPRFLCHMGPVLAP